MQTSSGRQPIRSRASSSTRTSETSAISTTGSKASCGRRPTSGRAISRATSKISPGGSRMPSSARSRRAAYVPKTSPSAASPSSTTSPSTQRSRCGAPPHRLSHCGSSHSTPGSAHRRTGVLSVKNAGTVHTCHTPGGASCPPADPLLESACAPGISRALA